MSASDISELANNHNQSRAGADTHRSEPASFDSVPATGPFAPDDVICELGDGLVVRRATLADRDALVRFNGLVQADPPSGSSAETTAGMSQGFDRSVACWSSDLTNGQHPRTRVSDFVIVEDTRRHRIASTLALLSHRFRYGDVELPAGQPELVGTHPDYRRRGLVERQMEIVHRVSERRGDLLQVIDGIPWYYRQFGYEMALEHQATRVVHCAQLAAAAASHSVRHPSDRSYRVRAADESDLAFVASCLERDAERLLLHCIRDEAFLRYELTQQNPQSHSARRYQIIEDAAGERAAAFHHHSVLWQQMLYSEFVQPAKGVAWQDIAGPYLQELDRGGRAQAARQGCEFKGAGFDLGSQHPLHKVIPHVLSQARTPYAWYVRVPDLVAFLTRVSPVLERNLAESDLAGHTGSLEISLYRRGVRIVLESGRISAIESWRPSTARFGDVAFPDLTFLQLVFGFRSLDELPSSFPDCLVERDASAAIVTALFPRRVSNLITTS